MAAKVNDWRAVLEIGRNDVCAAAGSGCHGVCLFPRCTFEGESESARGIVFAFEEETVSGTENRLQKGLWKESGGVCEERANDCNDDVNVEEGEGGIESGGPMVNYISGVCVMDVCRWVCGNADWEVMGVSENCVHRTVILMGSDGVAVVGSERKIDDLDANTKYG